MTVKRMDTIGIVFARHPFYDALIQSEPDPWLDALAARIVRGEY